MFATGKQKPRQPKHWLEVYHEYRKIQEAMAALVTLQIPDPRRDMMDAFL